MLTVRRATQKDRLAILRILKKTDLLYPGCKIDSFWLAEIKNKIVGVVRVEEQVDFAFIETLGVLPQFQRQGIAAQLLSESTKAVCKDLYLYTIIPAYFKKSGFKPIKPPAFIPSRKKYDCENCFSKQCVCMLRKKRHVP